MLQKQRQKQNDDSVNNNNDIDVIMMNHTLSKILIEINHMKHDVTTHCLLRSINNIMRNNASDFNLALHSTAMLKLASCCTTCLKRRDGGPFHSRSAFLITSQRKVGKSTKAKKEENAGESKLERRGYRWKSVDL